MTPTPQLPAAHPQQSGVSHRIISPDFSRMLDARPCDPLRFRALYPDSWSAFLRGHFQSAQHVGVFFGGDSKTARHWWEGTTGPQGWAVDFANETLRAVQ